MNTPKDTLEFILKGIVNADSVSVTEEELDGILILKIDIPSDIVGQVIGKEGKVIKAIRSILNLTYPNQRYQIQFPDEQNKVTEEVAA